MTSRCQTPHGFSFLDCCWNSLQLVEWTHQELLVAPSASQRRQIPVTHRDQDSGRRVLGARSQTTPKGNKNPNHPPCPGLNLLLHPKEPDISKPPQSPGKQGACPSSLCWSTEKGITCSSRNFQSSNVLSQHLGVKQIPKRHKAHKNQQQGTSLGTQRAQHPPHTRSIRQGSSTCTELFQPQLLVTQGRLIPSDL